MFCLGCLLEDVVGFFVLIFAGILLFQIAIYVIPIALLFAAWVVWRTHRINSNFKRAIARSEERIRGYNAIVERCRRGIDQNELRRTYV